MTKWPLLLTAAVCLGAPVLLLAQSTNAAAPMPPSALDNDEMTHLAKIRAEVLAAHPDLKAEEEKLKAMHDSAQGKAPSEDQRKADYIEWKAYQKKMRGEMLKIDPTLQPLFDKLDEARKHGGAAPFQSPK